MRNQTITLCALTILTTLSGTLDSPASAATLTKLFSFNGTNGWNPQAGLIADAAGNRYGTTLYGGPNGVGTVFKLDAGANTLITLATFSGDNGNLPYAGLISDAAGTLYGTTIDGGFNNLGTVFKLDPDTGRLTTLSSFTGSNGAHPYASLIADAAGNLYGTTHDGGASGAGTIFKLDVSNNYALATLASFNVANGGNPFGELIADAVGNLYGTTSGGGEYAAGTVFKLEANTNTLTTLVSFTGVNGSYPSAGLIVDATGNLYGTTGEGGTHAKGTVFRLDASNDYALATLATFTDSNGAYPYSGLIADAVGNLYGTTLSGGANNRGTVYTLEASNNYALTTLVSFTGTNGDGPHARLLADAAGNLYGTTLYGAPNSLGTVFKLEGTGYVVVPEPSALSLLAIAALRLLRSRH